MTDVTSLLQQAARVTTHPSADTIAADLRRGRRALARRRLRRGSTGVAAAALVGLGAATLLHAPATPAPTAQRTRPAFTQPAPIQLVAYTGAQPAGYTVDSVPDGWEIQGVNDFVLLIAPKGFPDTSLDSFQGKLTVMLQSVSQTELPPGTAVSVGSHRGWISHIDATAVQLFFTDDAGHKIDIQVPPALHWTDTQIADFGTQVHVNPGAEPGHG